MAAEQLLNGRYRLLRPLGTGGMASVYLAEDLRLGRRVAVKILHPQFAADPAFVARFDAEARTVAALSHPHIVQVYDVGHDGDRYYIVMEYVEGQTLKDAIAREGLFPVARALRVIGATLAALEFAHTHGLVHRDVKSQNVLLTQGGDVKVTDFGIARAIGGAGGPTLTATNMVIGTVQYFSPEQAQGRPATPQSDVYAASIVLYEMLTGKLPFEAENPLAVAMQQINQAPALPTRLNRAIPAPVEAIVLKAMAKNPAERYPSAAAMKAAVDGVLAGSIEGTRVTPRAAAAAPPPHPAGTTRMASRTVPAVNAGAATAAPARGGSRNLWVGIVALTLILFTLLGVLFRNGGFAGFGGGLAATETPTTVPITATALPATATTAATVTPRVVVPPVTHATATPAALTNTPVATTPAAVTPTLPGATDTATAQAATDTAAPPTDTSTTEPSPTDTAVPSTDTPRPTDTPTTEPSPTDTAVAPTDTPQATPTTGVSAGAGTVTLSPSSIKPGDTFTVRGQGWPANTTVTITGAFPNNTAQLGQTMAGDDGSFKVDVALNADTTPGTYIIRVTDDQGDTQSNHLAVNSP